jgi:NAD-dependent DNA ligase
MPNSAPRHAAFTVDPAVGVGTMVRHTMNELSPISPAAAADTYRRKCADSLQHLQGIVDGMICDGRMEPREIEFLSVWLTSHPEATSDWPGSVLHRKVRQIVADGLITGAEQRYLYEVLTHMASSHVAEAAATPPDMPPLPLDDKVDVALRGARVALAGSFLFGTRAACERLVASAGATLSERVSTKVDYLVIGARIAPSWTAHPEGAEIHEAVALQRLGHPIAIISERRLLDALA